MCSICFIQYFPTKESYFLWFKNTACLFKFREFNIKGVQRFLQEQSTVKLANRPIFDTSQGRRIVNTDNSCKMQQLDVVTLPIRSAHRNLQTENLSLKENMWWCSKSFQVSFAVSLIMAMQHQSFLEILFLRLYNRRSWTLDLYSLAFEFIIFFTFFFHVFVFALVLSCKKS